MALQLAYAIELTGDELQDALFRFTAGEPRRKEDWGEFSQALLREMLARQKTIDKRLTKALKNWRLERLNTVDRVILRLAVAEMIAFADIPLRATINEFLELAHSYGNDESPAFINGVLDTIAKDFPEKDVQKSDVQEDIDS